IRTLLLAPVGADGSRRGEMGTGAGIVHDSQAASEYAECQLKARFLVGLPADFDLFETLYATREAGCRHIALHLQRLCASAVCLGFAHDRAQLRAALQSACRQLPPATPSRLRLTLAHNGTCTTTCAPLQALPALVRVLLTNEVLAVDRMLLRHKITVRTQYDRAWQSAEAHGAFDMLFQNQQGELTEGARSNLFLRLDGSWYTPPLDAGLLPGIMRSVLLADPQWRATERRLTVEDLARADKVVMCSALRGVLVASVERFPPAVHG
ncbi:MAG: aminotransferase class IV, partial [Herminiimonas sp.]|nr:aminotransferase class IV [Herminiimonas sp.]